MLIISCPVLLLNFAAVLQLAGWGGQLLSWPTCAEIVWPGYHDPFGIQGNLGWLEC